MATRFAVLGDVHGNLLALEAALADIKRHRAERILVLGDYVFNGPRPAETVDRLRALEADGALVVQGNTDIAVADLDYAAAFPWFDDVPAAYRAAAEWAHDRLSEQQLDWLRGLPAERRVWADNQLVLVCHASPGSQTAGLTTDLDPGVTIERVTRTDARVIACGHTHIADVRELGRKLIVNPGSCGFAFDGEATANWAMLTIPDQPAHDAEAGDEPPAEAAPLAQLYRPDYDAQTAAEEVAERGLTGDVYRAATIRTGRFVR